MAYITPNALDAQLDYIREKATAILLLKGEPTDYADAGSKTLGVKENPTISAPAGASPNGRKITISAFSDGTVEATDEATHWALVDDDGEELLAANTVQNAQHVTQGNTFALGAFDIRQPAPSS